MKLNLLPTKYEASDKSKTAFGVMILLTLAGLIVAIFLIVTSKGALQSAMDREADARTRAQQLATESSKADSYAANTDVLSVARNISLAKAMASHNGVYPALYDKVRLYIPSFFRVTSMSASPIDDSNCTVNLTGVISSYQQYADLMLALLRIPGAKGVSRTGYVLNEPYIPNLTQTDQTGRPILPGQSNLPDDPLNRISLLQGQAKAPGYSQSGNFGGDSSLTRGATPDESLITVQVTFPYNLMTPDPEATIKQTPSPSAAGQSTNPSGPVGQPGGGPGGPPPGGPSGGPGGDPSVTNAGGGR